MRDAAVLEYSPLPTEAPAELNLCLQEARGDRRARICLRPTGGNRVTILIEGEIYEGEIRSRTSIAPEGDWFGVTVLTGVCNGVAAANLLLVVNCGLEPPEFAISVRDEAGCVRASNFRITHDVQHEILDVLPHPD